MSSSVASPVPSSSSRRLGSKHNVADDVCELQISALREVMQKMKSDVVRELELVLQRELHSNFEKIEAVVRDMHPRKAAGIDLNISSNRQQADAPLDPSIGKGHRGDADTLALSTMSLREADKKVEEQFISYFQRLDDLGIHHDQFREPELDDSASEASETREEIPEEDEILKVVVRGRKEALQVFLEKNLDPNLELHDVNIEHNPKKFSHCSLLALAVLAGRRSEVSLLVSMKANIESTYGMPVGIEGRNWSGPAVTATVVRNDIPMFKLLLELKADLATKASNGANCIWQCCYFGNHEILQLCLSSVDVSTKTIGQTAEFQWQPGIWYSPLHISVVMGQESCSRLLLDAKAPVDLKNEQKETPLDIAIHFCHPDVVTLLVKEGAQITEQKEKPSIVRNSSWESSDCVPRLWTRGPGVYPSSTSADDMAKEIFFGFKGRMVHLFTQRSNPVLVLAVARGLQSQPEQVERLTPGAILEFWRTDDNCMSAILEAMFVERHLRFNAKNAGVKEHKTAIVRKSESLSAHRHKIVVSSRYSYGEFFKLETSKARPDDDMMKFIARLTPQKKVPSSCALRLHRLHHVPIIVYECLVPNFHNDLRFLQGFANAAALDKIYLKLHCQAIIKYTWDRVRKLAVIHCIAHLIFLAFFIYIAIRLNLIGFYEIDKDALEYEDINSTVRWISLMVLPFWLFELGAECIEFVVHIKHGWTLHFLMDARNAADFGRIFVDGVVVFSFIFWGFHPTEDVYFRSFLGAVCALKWTKMLYCLTPFRRIGLPVLPILFTLGNILTSVAIMFVYISGLAHAIVALDVLPHRFTFTILHASMFGVSSDLGEVQEINNPNGQEDFKSWWLQFILGVATFALPITFMNIFIAAMSSSYEQGTTHMEELFQNRCAEAGFSHACVDYAFKKLRRRSREEREERLWYCCDRSED